MKDKIAEALEIVEQLEHSIDFLEYLASKKKLSSLTKFEIRVEIEEAKLELERLRNEIINDTKPE